jgi:hypothetical protein
MSPRRHVDLVGQRHRHRHRARLGGLEVAVERHDRATRVRAPDGRTMHLVADGAARRRRACRRSRGSRGSGADQLHRQPQLDEVAVAGDVHRLEVGEQRRPWYHGMLAAAVTTFSPVSADIGTNTTSWTSSLAMNAGVLGADRSKPPGRSRRGPSC